MSEEMACLNCFTINPSEYCCGSETEIVTFEELLYLVKDLQYKGIVDRVFDEEEMIDRFIIND